MDYDAAASECEGQSVLTTLHALKQYGMQLEREKADLEVKLRQVEQERDQVRARVWDEAADRVGPHDDLYLEWRLKAKMLREGGRDVQDR